MKLRECCLCPDDTRPARVASRRQFPHLRAVKKWGLAPSRRSYHRQGVFLARCLSPFFHSLFDTIRTTAMSTLPLTPQRLAANRRNAQKSTGPRTRSGKKRSSRNHTTHGLDAEQPRLTNAEKGRRWRMIRAWEHDFQTVDERDHDLIAQVATARVMLERASAAEAALCPPPSGSNPALPTSAAMRLYLRHAPRWDRMINDAVKELIQRSKQRLKAAKAALKDGPERLGACILTPSPRAGEGWGEGADNSLGNGRNPPLPSPPPPGGRGPEGLLPLPSGTASERPGEGEPRETPGPIAPREPPAAFGSFRQETEVPARKNLRDPATSNPPGFGSEDISRQDLASTNDAPNGFERKSVETRPMTGSNGLASSFMISPARWGLYVERHFGVRLACRLEQQAPSSTMIPSASRIHGPHLLTSNHTSNTIHASTCPVTATNTCYESRNRPA